MRDFSEFEDVFENIYAVYFTMYNGDVKVIKTEKNMRPEFSFDVDGVVFNSQPIILMQTDYQYHRAFVYICVFPESNEDIGKFFSFTEKDRAEFSKFIENIKPSDFKKIEEDDKNV